MFFDQSVHKIFVHIFCLSMVKISKQSDRSFCKFWQKNLKTRMPKKQFVIWGLKKEVFMTYWYIIKFVKFIGNSSPYLHFLKTLTITEILAILFWQLNLNMRNLRKPLRPLSNSQVFASIKICGMFSKCSNPKKSAIGLEGAYRHILCFAV